MGIEAKSTLIVGALLIAFVFYISAKGELATYLGVFYGPVTPGQPITGASGATSSSGAGLDLGTIGNYLTTGYAQTLPAMLGSAQSPSAANPLYIPGTSDVLDVSGT